MSVEQEIKDGIRRLLVEKGQKVLIEEWGGVSPYGWTDYDAWEHADECHWVIPEGVVVEEVSYDMFDGTFTSNKNEVGLNATGCRCACGKYTDVTLRYVGALGEAIRSIIGYDPSSQVRL
ncbi:hypothetical protein PBI_GAIA_59 [Mycobacterium phage Gaia]|uniref:Uncharacterized protein n=1 Tax=Mycobacterium phage Gaia TaxID=1486472 RepID=A0A068F3G2_9CAUD|nr:hypothetical protein VC46_gp174 [Mycobacterium phage Gaia]AID58878.1 hypothetical protein PBI_GAIA_59 [Mycobacterium phage Gaia]AYQ99999.1 hypothetical protein PBI_NEBKISS_60 [Mycobacterium phage Nebkiss]